MRQSIQFCYDYIAQVNISTQWLQFEQFILSTLSLVGVKGVKEYSVQTVVQSSNSKLPKSCIGNVRILHGDDIFPFYTWLLLPGGNSDDTCSKPNHLPGHVINVLYIGSKTWISNGYTHFVLS